MTRADLVPLRILSNPSEARAEVAIYKPFFLAGILSVLTAGCLLGAVALAGIARAGSYTASAWTPYVLAHANSQLFGWVGFFVMGFALQQHAPSTDKVKLFHRLAYLSLGLMAGGVALRFVAEPLCDVAGWLPTGRALGVLACSMQLAAVLAFLFNNSFTRHRTGQKLPWQSLFVFGSLFWLLAISIAEPFVFLGSHQADKSLSVQFVAQWFSPLREAQFLGFVAMMIFGVSLVKFNTCFGAPEADRPNGILGFAFWTVGLLLRIIGWISAFRQGLEPGTQTIYFASGVFLAIGAGYVVLSSGVFGDLDGNLRSHKFIRASYAWLLIAGLLLILEPLHLRAIGQPFSHAYTGAIRHAVTVGFISQMILGVGAHVAARMNDVPEINLNRLWPTFWLLNIGNTARVALEVGTDYSPSTFAPMGITGFIELAGLVLWAAEIVRVMNLGRSMKKQVQHAS